MWMSFKFQLSGNCYKQSELSAFLADNKWKFIVSDTVRWDLSGYCAADATSSGVRVRTDCELRFPCWSAMFLIWAVWRFYRSELIATQFFTFHEFIVLGQSLHFWKLLSSTVEQSKIYCFSSGSVCAETCFGMYRPRTIDLHLFVCRTVRFGTNNSC